MTTSQEMLQASQQQINEAQQQVQQRESQIAQAREQLQQQQSKLQSPQVLRQTPGIQGVLQRQAIQSKMSAAGSQLNLASQQLEPTKQQIISAQAQLNEAQQSQADYDYVLAKIMSNTPEVYPLINDRQRQYFDAIRRGQDASIQEAISSAEAKAGQSFTPVVKLEFTKQALGDLPKSSDVKLGLTTQSTRNNLSFDIPQVSFSGQTQSLVAPQLAQSIVPYQKPSDVIGTQQAGMKIRERFRQFFGGQGSIPTAKQTFNLITTGAEPGSLASTKPVTAESIITSPFSAINQFGGLVGQNSENIASKIKVPIIQTQFANPLNPQVNIPQQKTISGEILPNVNFEVISPSRVGQAANIGAQGLLYSSSLPLLYGLGGTQVYGGFKQTREGNILTGLSNVGLGLATVALTKAPLKSVSREVTSELAPITESKASELSNVLQVAPNVYTADTLYATNVINPKTGEIIKVIYTKGESALSKTAKGVKGTTVTASTSTSDFNFNRGLRDTMTQNFNLASSTGEFTMVPAAKVEQGALQSFIGTGKSEILDLGKVSLRVQNLPKEGEATILFNKPINQFSSLSNIKSDLLSQGQTNRDLGVYTVSGEQSFYRNKILTDVYGKGTFPISRDLTKGFGSVFEPRQGVINAEKIVTQPLELRGNPTEFLTTYHATSSKNVPNILKEGLQPSAKTGNYLGKVKPLSYVSTGTTPEVSGFGGRSVMSKGGEVKTLKIEIPKSEAGKYLISDQKVSGVNEVRFSEVPAKYITELAPARVPSKKDLALIQSASQAQTSGIIKSVIEPKAIKDNMIFTSEIITSKVPSTTNELLFGAGRGTSSQKVFSSTTQTTKPLKLLSAPQKSMVIQAESPISIQPQQNRQEELLRLRTDISFNQNTVNVPRLDENIRQTETQIPALSFKQESAQQQALRFRTSQTTPTPTQTPRITPRVPPSKLFSSDEFGKKVISLFGKLRKSYNVFVRRKGKEVLIGKNLPFGRAEERGVKNVMSTLARSFTLKESGVTSLADINYQIPGNIFRPSKREAGRLVQRAKFSLSSGTERSEIQSARRTKKPRMRFFK